MTKFMNAVFVLQSLALYRSAKCIYMYYYFWLCEKYPILKLHKRFKVMSMLSGDFGNRQILYLAFKFKEYLNLFPSQWEHDENRCL